MFKNRFLDSFKDFFLPLTNTKVFLIILSAGIIVFSNSILNHFVADDISQIVQNPLAQSIENIPIFFNGSTFYNGGNLTGVYYKPLLNTFFSIIYIFFGPDYSAFHVFQILLHISNAFLLFLLLKQFFKKPLALLLSLIFLIHPINSEAVFYISATQEPLSFFFGVTALLLISNFKSKVAFIGAALYLLLSILSKETGIIFFMLAVYMLMYKKEKILPLVSIVLIFLTYVLLRINAVGIFTVAESSPIGRLNLLDRFLNFPAIIFFYLKTFFFPLSLASSYNWVYKQITFQSFIVPLVLDLACIATIVWFGFILYKKNQRKDFNVYCFFLLWFLIGMFIHLNVLPLDATVAERWFYFPIAGLLGMIGVLLNSFNIKIKDMWIFVIAIILMFSIRTVVRSFDWRDNITLATRDIKVSNTYDQQNIISNEFIRQGKYNEAKKHAEQSIKLYPYLTNYLNLAAAYLGLKDYKMAKKSYLKALRYGDYYLIYEGLGGLALVYGNPEDNISFLQSSLKKFPQDARLWLYLAILEYKMGYSDKARNAIDNAYALDKGREIILVHDIIMNNKPFNVEFSVGSQ